MISIKTTLATLMLILSFSVFGQNNLLEIWQDMPKKSTLPKGNRLIIPNKYRTVQLDEINLQSLLATAPKEGIATTATSETILPIPMPDGSITEYRIVNYSMMEPLLAAKFPNIKTYYGRGKDNPRKRIRLDWTAAGFRAMMIDSEGTSFIDPYAQNNTKTYISYYKKDYPNPSEPFYCGVEAEEIEKTSNSNNSSLVAGDCTLRTYRLAMAVTGEYSNFFGVTSSAGEATIMAEVINSINRVNEVYEVDATVRLILIGNTELAFYYNGQTDPYTNNDGSPMLGENIANCAAVFGSGNYDIGHVYSTGGGGVAYLNSPCGSLKAGGVTGQNAPTNDPFWIDYVAHEIGHQFGGNHTQNNACNRSSASVEPGSASTIMGYAGICAPNVQGNSDPYFHGISQQEIGVFVTGTGNSCATAIANPNTAPSVDPISNYTIPASTPFVLTASASDNEGDPLTYCWEQMDNATATMPPVSTNTDGPAFRSLLPKVSPQRYFPDLATIISNGSDDWEVLPSVSRSMNFTVTVRDNSTSAAGCTTETEMDVIVDGSSGPFLVTLPNASGIIWIEGDTKTVTWDVAGTTGSPVNCANVDILLSYDGGLTYPTTVISNTPNDGTQSIIVPSGVSSTVRMMVKCSDNIFFDISNNDLEIQAGGETFALEVLPASQTVCQGIDATYTANVNSIGGFTGSVNLSTSNNPTNANITIANSTVNAGGNTNITISNTSAVASGTYPITLTGSSSSETRTLEFTLIVNEMSGTIALTAPTDGSISEGTSPTLTWNADANSTDYQIQIATDIGFTNIITDVTRSTNSYSASGLTGLTTYYWRVKGFAPCEGAFSSPFSFTTKDCITSSVSPETTISASGTPTITSVINITKTGTIEDINITSITGTHTWASDLDVVLIAPSNTTVNLFNDLCGDTGNFNIGFDDASSNVLGNVACSPLGGGLSYQPTGSLASLNGQDADGDWTLQIMDDQNQDGGVLTSWEIEICYSIVLPVEWLNFEANPLKEEIELNWSTALENNNYGFEIERKAENEFNYQNIGFVKSVEFLEAKNDYSFLDRNVVKGITYQYRLKQIDLDGKSSYSQIKSAKLNGKNPIVFIYPNPANNILNCSVKNNENGQVDIRLVNLNGQVIQQFISNSETNTLSIESIPSGLYLIEIRTGKQFFVERLVKN